MVDRFDDPEAVAVLAATLEGPVLVGLDVDGVLAPIVSHAADAELLPGVLEAVAELALRVDVAIVSGRSVEDLGRFEFPDDLEMFGLHGLERRDERVVELVEHEQARLDRLAELAEDAAERAGDGAWVESKPAGVVLHLREAHPERAARTADELLRDAEDVTGAHIKPGHGVIELLARSTSKATAMAELRDELGARQVVFVGDDRTDEEVFRALTADGSGLGVKVGPGDTAAAHRLRDPEAVLHFLHALATTL